MPFESYATLLSRKVMVPSAKPGYVAVEQQFWAETLAGRIEAIALDEEWYCRRYPDVAGAIKAGVLPGARQHYRDSGYFEHRLPYPITVDARWYLMQYDDVSTALSRKLYPSAQEHFEEVGFKEGRLPYAGFSLGGDGRA